MAESLSIKRFFKGSIDAFLAKVLGVVLAFFLQVLIARTSGPFIYGEYVYWFAWATMAATLIPIGFDRAVVRFIPEYLARGQIAAARSYLSWARLLIFGTSALVLLGIGVFGFSRQQNNTNTFSDLYLAAAALSVITALAKLDSEAIRGTGRVFASELYSAIARPMIAIVIIAVMVYYVGASLDAAEVLAISAVAGLITLVMSARKLDLSLKRQDKSKPLIDVKTSKKEWWTVAVPFMFVGLGNVLSARSDVLLLGWLASNESVGIYNSANRIAALAGFPLLAINSMLAPTISRLNAAGNVFHVRRAVAYSAWVGFIASALVSIVTYVTAGFLFSLYGDGFEGGIPLLGIILVGQLFSSSAGSVGYVLAMTGYQAIVARVAIGSAAVSIALNAALIPSYQEYGAAAACAATLCFSNFLMVWCCMKRLRINPTIFSIAVISDLTRIWSRQRAGR